MDVRLGNGTVITVSQQCGSAGYCPATGDCSCRTTVPATGTMLRAAMAQFDAERARIEASHAGRVAS